MYCLAAYKSLHLHSPQGVCRYGNLSEGCAIPCGYETGCDQVTGECQGQCPDDYPQGHPWHGPGCRIGILIHYLAFYLYIDNYYWDIWICNSSAQFSPQISISNGV